MILYIGKARRLKQAKDEATEEIEKYRQERDKQFKEFEAKVRRLKCIFMLQIMASIRGNEPFLYLRFFLFHFFTAYGLT